MSESILERAARAAADADQEDYDEAPLLFREIARAVLQAIREPSEALIQAGDLAILALGETRGLGIYGSEECWRAMIDAAIAERKHA
jgi:hypothetical protein